MPLSSLTEYAHATVYLSRKKMPGHEVGYEYHLRIMENFDDDRYHDGNEPVRVIYVNYGLQHGVICSDWDLQTVRMCQN